MITALDLRPIELLASLSETELESLAKKAADIHLSAGSFAAHEGENPYFFIVLQGALTAFKHSRGRNQSIGSVPAGTCLGEVPIILGTRQIVSLRADEPCRLARFEVTTFHQLVHDHPECHAQIEALFTLRVDRTIHTYETTWHSRVLIGSSFPDEATYQIRHFLNLSRITCERSESVRANDATEQTPENSDALEIVIDGTPLPPEVQTIQAVAEALGMRTHPSQTDYDVLVVGGGPAGLAASVYAASEGLKVLTVEGFAAGGQAGTSPRIENYLGFPEGISGDDLADRALRQAERLGAEIVVTRRVTSLKRMGSGQYCCELDSGDSFLSKAVILATGVTWRMFDVEGIARLRGHGVMYGAAQTEAASVMGKDIFIVGAGNSAGQAAVYFSSYANSVTILVRGSGLEKTMSQYLIEQISQKPNIEVEPLTEVLAVQGRDVLESIKTVRRDPLRDRQASRVRKADALFILIGAVANTGWLPEELLRDEKGFICTGPEMTNWTDWKEERQPFLLETNLPGVFCAGDARHDSVKRVSASVGEGSMSVTFVHKYLALLEAQRLNTPKTI